MKQLSPGKDYIGISVPFLCTDEDGYLLMHKRSNKCRDEQGRWDHGGGQLEFGETPEEGVLREVEEEYGCKAEIITRLPATSVFRQIDGVKTHWLALPFIVKVKRKNVKIGEPEKVDEFGWFTLNALPQPLHTGFENFMLKTEKIEILRLHIKSE